MCLRKEEGVVYMRVNLSVTFGPSPGKQLRVFSLTSNRKKTLSENCQGSFTTAPDKLYMYLYEITVNLAEALPCKVRRVGLGVWH